VAFCNEVFLDCGGDFFSTGETFSGEKGWQDTYEDRGEVFFELPKFVLSIPTRKVNTKLDKTYQKLS